MKIKQVIREHRSIAILFGFELLVLIWAFCLLFGERTVIDINPENADYFNSCTINDGKLQINQSENEVGIDIVSAEYTNIKLKPGRYNIEAVYSAELEGFDAASWSGGNEMPICNIGVTSGTFIQQLVGSGFNIYTGTSYNSEPFWINSITSCKDLSLKVTYKGYGNITIEKLIISESVYFRYVRFFTIFFIFTLINIIVCILKNIIKTAYDKKIVIGIMAVTVFSSLPMIYRYLIVGHDLTFHIARIAEIAEGIKAGNWLIKIQPDMINGYGYATPLFYPQLFLYIPALLYVIGFPLHTSYQIFIVLINFGTCLISYVSLVKICKNKNLAFIGSFLYVLAPYRLSELYVAGRLGEILSMIFFPLIIYGIYNIYSEEKILTFKKCIPLILGVSGVMQSHLVSILFVGIFAIMYALFNLRKTFKPKRLCYLAVSVMVVIMLNAWFIVPFIDSMDMDIMVNGDGILRFQGSGVYPIQMPALFYFGRGTNVPMLVSDEFCLSMGAALIIGITVWLYAHYKSVNSEKRNESMFALGNITGIFAIMTIVFSLWIFPWDEINNISRTIAVWLAKVEFSWRFLSVGTAFAAFCTVSGLYYAKELNKKIYSYSIIAMAAFTIISAGFFYADLAFGSNAAQICYKNDVDDFALGVTNDYQLADTDLDMCKNKQIDVTSDLLTVTSYSSVGGKTEIGVMNAETEAFEKVIIPVFYYPGYKAYDSDTGEQFYIEAGANKKIMVNVPAGYNGKITVRYVEKSVWRLSEIVSLLTLSALVITACINNRKKTA
jgi:hypothetical protein